VLILHFTANHQEFMMKKNLMKKLFKLLKSKNTALQTKVFELLFHFDGSHQQAMIDLGILDRIDSLMFQKDLQIQSKALSLIQYFERIRFFPNF
jgi:hypothetical protein